MEIYSSMKPGTSTSAGNPTMPSNFNLLGFQVATLNDLKPDALI